MPPDIIAPEATPASFPEPLTGVDREVVKTLSLSGLGDAAILARFPTLKDATLRQWRARDPIWSAAFQAVRAKRKVEAMAVTEQKVQAVTDSVTGTISELHAGTALQLVQASAQALKAFAASPAPVTDWQTAQTAYKVQRLAAGIDKEGGEVRVNVAMFTEQAGGKVSHEIETEAWEVDGSSQSES